MKGEHLLPLLLGLAISTAGWLIGNEKANHALASLPLELDSNGGPQSPLQDLTEENIRLYRILGNLEAHILGKEPPETDLRLTSFVEKHLGTPFKTTPKLPRFSQAIIAQHVEEWIDARLPPKDQATYSKALELLGLLPAQLSYLTDPLRDSLITNELAARRYFLNDLTGEAYLTADFQERDPYHRASLVELLTRIHLAQHHPLPKDATFDQWIGYRGLTEAIALHLHRQYLNENPPTSEDDDTGDDPPLDSAENEREAILLGLPLLGHAIAQLAPFHGRTYLETWLSENPQSPLPQSLPPHPFSTGTLFGASNTQNIRLHCPQIEDGPQFALGILPLRLLIEAKLAQEELDSLCSQLQTDRFWIINSPQDSIPPSLLWALNFHEPTTAARLSTLLKDHTPGENMHLLSGHSENTLIILSTPEPKALPKLQQLQILTQQ